MGRCTKMHKKNTNLSSLRSKHFQKCLNINNQLVDLSRNLESHSFLRNPASQSIYLYLIDYVRGFCENWFQADLTTLKFLDWGCGKGFISFLMREIGAQITSCDVLGGEDSAFSQSTPIIDKISLPVVLLEHPYILPFEDTSFDVVLSFGVLEHVSNDLESLKEIYRVLKPHGLLFCFFLPYYFSWTQRLAHLRGDFYHDRLYTKEKVKQLLDRSNLQLLDLWHRQLFPKNRIVYTNYHSFELLDQWLIENTFLKYIATNIEFVVFKS